MSDPPRRLPPGPSDRLQAAIRSTGVQSGRGSWPGAQPVTAAPSNALVIVGTLAVVFHGDDPNVPRPLADFVRWVGAAVPVNGLPFDDIYPVTL